MWAVPIWKRWDYLEYYKFIFMQVGTIVRECSSGLILIVKVYRMFGCLVPKSGRSRVPTEAGQCTVAQWRWRFHVQTYISATLWGYETLALYLVLSFGYWSVTDGNQRGLVLRFVVMKYLIKRSMQCVFGVLRPNPLSHSLFSIIKHFISDNFTTSSIFAHYDIDTFIINK